MAAKSSKQRSLLSVRVRDFVDNYLLRIDLDADYQREKVWSTAQQEKLLDSILTDIDIPKIYLVEVKDNEQFDYECIDGKQRMITLSRFFKPEAREQSPLTLRLLEQQYTFKQLKKEHPSIAKRVEEYRLSFCIYESIDDGYVREIFRRLQLGIRLNSGELLKTKTGTIRDFIYTTIGNTGPFLRRTNLSERRFSRPFTLAQICVNSFAMAGPEGDFVRARYQDIEEFFDQHHDLDKKDPNLIRMKQVLSLLDKAFGKKGVLISSRAIAVSAFLFAEELVKQGRTSLVPKFAEFYLKLLTEIKMNMDLIREYKRPTNPSLLEQFQKHVLQASVEAHAIKRRHAFLTKSFAYFLDARTKGKILGSL